MYSANCVLHCITLAIRRFNHVSANCVLHYVLRWLYAGFNLVLADCVLLPTGTLAGLAGHLHGLTVGYYLLWPLGGYF